MTAGSPTTIARPDWAGDNYWDGTKNELKVDALKGDLAYAATARSRELTLPKAPGEIPFALPADFKAPDGITFALDPNDPLVPQAQQAVFDLAYGKLSPAEAMAKFAALYASGKVGDIQSINTARTAEIGKLGANGTARVTAAKTWLASMVGNELAEHMASSGMATAAQVGGWETIMRKVQGGAAFGQQHRDTPETPGKIPGYEKMSFEQRRAAQDNAARARSN